MEQSAYFLHRVIASWIQAGGILLAAATFVWSVLRARRQNQIARYEDLTIRWVDYFRACRENPDLDVSPFSKTEGETPVPPSRIKEQNLFLELLLLGERAFVLNSVVGSCADLDPDVLRRFLGTFAPRLVFQDTFQKTRGWLDRRYVTFVEDILKTVPEGKATNP